MGKFGCTQIRTSSSCSSKKTKDVKKKMGGGGGFEYIAQRFNRPFDKNGQKHFDPFFDSLGEVFGQKMGLQGGSVGSFWLKCSPSIAERSLEVANVSPHREKFPHADTKALLGKIGQIPLCA